MSSHLDYHVIRDGKKYFLLGDEKLTMNEYWDLLHRNSQEYIRANTRRLGRKVSFLVSQRLQEGMTPRGLTASDGLVILYHEAKINNITLTLKTEISLKKDVYWVFLEAIKLLGYKSENMIGTLSEFDDIFCLIALNFILPEQETLLFSVV